MNLYPFFEHFFYPFFVFVLLNANDFVMLQFEKNYVGISFMSSSNQTPVCSTPTFAHFRHRHPTGLSVSVLIHILSIPTASTLWSTLLASLFLFWLFSAPFHVTLYPFNSQIQILVYLLFFSLLTSHAPSLCSIQSSWYSYFLIQVQLLPHTGTVTPSYGYSYSLIQAELCALVNKPSGASAGASDLKYQRRYRER